MCVALCTDSDLDDDDDEDTSEVVQPEANPLIIKTDRSDLPEAKPRGKPHKRKWDAKDKGLSENSQYSDLGEGNSFAVAKPWSSWSSTPGVSTVDSDSSRKAMQEVLLPDFDANVLDARGPSDFYVKVMEEAGNFTPATFHKERKASLMDLLSSTTEGCAILAHYKKFNSLNNRMRGKLSDIVMRNELASDPNRKIDVRRFVVLSRAISVSFPTEDPYTYYVPYTNLGGGKKSSAKGKLCDKYHNLRRNFRESGLIPPRGAPQTGEDYDKEREFDNLDYHNIYA